MSSDSRESSKRGKEATPRRFAANDPQEGRAKPPSEGAGLPARLSQRELKVAAQLLSVLSGLDADRNRELSTILRKAATAEHRYKHRELWVESARQTFADRALRAQFFNEVMFGEPAWDMLLVLYVSEQTGAEHTVSGLLSLAGAPHTTSLRWLDLLTKERLVSRRAHPTDKRVVYVALTDKGLGALDAYFSAAIAPTM